MPKTTLLLLAFAAALSACDDKPKNPPPQTAREDNPLLKYQDETVNKAQNKIDAGVEHTQQQLDAVDKQ